MRYCKNCGGSGTVFGFDYAIIVCPRCGGETRKWKSLGEWICSKLGAKK